MLGIARVAPICGWADACRAKSPLSDVCGLLIIATGTLIRS